MTCNMSILKELIMKINNIVKLVYIIILAFSIHDKIKKIF